MRKVGFDIHGVIDKNPELFSKIIKELKELDFEIHVLTGSLPSKKLTEELDSYGIEYDFLFSILGYHKSNGTEMWKDDNGWWIDDDVWNRTKANYCYDNGLDFHIDDTKIYGNYFKTPFGHITTRKENPRILEINGDVDDDILEIFKNHEGYYKITFI